MNKFLTKSMEKIFNTLGSNLDEFKDKTILITGANGLIGGFLSEFFMYVNDAPSRYLVEKYTSSYGT